MKNICRYIAFVMAFVMTLMMVSCGADKGTDVAQNTKSTATNSKSTSSVVSSEVVSSVAVSSEAVSSVATSSEAASSVAVSSSATSSKVTSSGAWSSGKVTHGNSAGDVVISPNYESSSRTVSSWVCPDPSAHPGAEGYCYDQRSHDNYVKESKELAEYEKWFNENVLPTIPEGYTKWTWCTRCNRPKGDGHNGTCDGFLENGKHVCRNYD